MEEQFSDTHKESSQRVPTQGIGWLLWTPGPDCNTGRGPEDGRGRRIERDSLSKQHTFCDAIAGFPAK